VTECFGIQNVPALKLQVHYDPCRVVHMNARRPCRVVVGSQYVLVMPTEREAFRWGWAFGIQMGLPPFIL
jgi:hypothetical protein